MAVPASIDVPMKQSLPPARDLRQQIADTQRESLAERLNLRVEEVKPCLAGIGGQPEGQRFHFAQVLAYELVKANVSQERAEAYLRWYVGQCDQPPQAGSRSSEGEALAALRSVLSRKAAGGKIYGYGCVKRDSPLLESCPYGVDRDPEHRFRCPYVEQRRVAPNRRQLVSLVGSLNLLHQHLRKRIPKGWRPLAATRRALLYLLLGKLEVEAGHPGGELWTSERKLEQEYPLPVSRGTLRRDLGAMQTAGWLEWTRGKTHVQSAAEGRRPRGMGVRRLMWGEAPQRRPTASPTDTSEEA
jgi:hypothetical protein